MTDEHEVDLEALPQAPTEAELRELYPEEPALPEGELAEDEPEPNGAT
jgi:hypothetical protein